MNVEGSGAEHAIRHYTLDDPPFAGGTGRGVTVAVVDSGVHAAHAHVRGRVSGGIDLVASGDLSDRLGHGTAVAAAILDKAPEATIFAVKVFDRALATTADLLARAIVVAAEHGAQLINLSLGTPNAARAAILQQAVEKAGELGSLVVAAAAVNGAPWFPGSLTGVAGVVLEPELDRGALVVSSDAAGGRTFRASGYPRPIPGVPPERNLSGISFAVANVTGFLSRIALDRDALGRA